MSGNSWVTLATNDTYSLGALVLARSLKRVGTNHNLTVMVTPGVSAAMRDQLTSVFNVLEEVNILDSKDEKNLALLTRPELGITFTKLHCWRLTQFSKCVFLDADVLVLQNCDELFDREELSAAPDVGWPDCFNSGVFVYRPSIETYNALINFALSQGSFDGGDQGLLNQFFSDWATKDIRHRLPFIYNMCSSATYSYLPAFKHYGQNVKIVHFIGTAKPWLQYLESESRQVQPSPGSEHLQGLLQLWWDIFCNDVHSTLSTEMAGLAGALSQLTLGVARSPEQIALEEHLRKQAWEHGNIDYMNRDSFDNIWRKICQTLAEAPSADPLPEQREPSSQVSSVVVECRSKEVTPADDTPTLSKSHSLLPAQKENKEAIPSSESEPVTKTVDIPSDSISISDLNNISSLPEVQTDTTSLPIHADPTLADPVAMADVNIPKHQDSTVNQKLVQPENTVSSSAIEIHSEFPSVVTQTVILQDTESQLLAVDEESNLGAKIEEKVENKEEHVPLPSQDFSKSSVTVGVLDSDRAVKSISDSSPKPSDIGESKESDIMFIPHSNENVTVSSTGTLLLSEALESQSISEAHTADVLPIVTETEGIHTEATDSKSTIDLAQLPESCPTIISSLDSLVDTQKVSVTAPTPPTSPTDSSTSGPPAPSATDTLSVEPSIPPTPPVVSELPCADTVPKSDPISVTSPTASEPPNAKTAQSPDPVFTAGVSEPPSDATTQCSDPTSIDPSLVSSPSESHGIPESTSQTVDPKVPIPPKRRHKPSQNPDQSGRKSGKPTSAFPKEKK